MFVVNLAFLINRKFHTGQNIANNSKGYVYSDEDAEVQVPVADTSVNRMEIEEIHFVEKDITPKDPVEESVQEENSAHKDDTLEAKPKSYERMKEGLRSLVPKRPKIEERKSSCCCAFLKMFLSVLVPLCIVLVSLEFREQSYQHSIVFANVTVELRKQIYGQARAVEALGDYLQLDKPALKMIALVGGTGVGKSYTVEMIESNFPKYSVRRYFPPIGVTMNDVGFSFLYPKLIVLENLREHDLTDVVGFLKTRDKVAVNQYITVMAVFNVERMTDDLIRSVDLGRSAKTLRDSFAGEDLDVKVVTYEPLGSDVLVKCIADAARRSEVTLSDDDVEFVKRQLVTNNVGCKGAYSKVQLIGKN